MEALAMLGMVLFQVLFVGAIAYGAWAITKQRRDKQRRRWAAVADRHGLSFTPGAGLAPPTMRGTIDQAQVLATTTSRSAGKSSVPYTVVRAISPISLPPGLKVTREGMGDALARLFGGQDITLGDELLDRTLRIQGLDEEAVRAVLLDPDVQRLLPAIMSGSPFNRIEHGAVILEEQGMEDVHLESHLASAVALARALGQAVEAPWLRLAEHTGLTVQGTPGGVDIEGEVHGLRVKAQVRVGRSDEGPQTTVRITLPEGLPRLGISLAERGAADRGVRLGDPVLDGLIRVDARDEAAARALLTGPGAEAVDLHGKLLAVVHGRPGSVVSGREVRVLGTGATAGHAGDLIEEGLALARALVEVSPLRATEEESAEAGRAQAAARAPLRQG